MKTKIYLSGLISTDQTTEQIEKNKAKIRAKADELTAEGYNVFHTANIARDYDQSEWMYISFVLQSHCEESYFLSNYIRSNGARMELINAKALKHVIKHELQTMSSIAALVCEKENITIDFLKSKLRNQNIVDARSIFCYICKLNTKKTDTEIGAFVNRSRVNATRSISQVTLIKELQEKILRYEI